MTTSTFDRAGVALSALCILHCLLLPMAAGVLPMVGLWAENEMIHKVLVLLAIVPALFAFFGSISSRIAPLIRGLGLLGISLLIAGAFVESLHDFETVLTVLGAVTLASAHIWRLSRNRAHPHVN